MRTTLVVTAIAAALVAAATSLGAGPAVFAQPVAVGTIASPITVKVKRGPMVVTSIRVAPGGSFGWHTHGGAVAVVVTGGTLTVFDPSIDGCRPFTVSKGQAFVEPANHVHLARNDGTKPATLYATYLGIPSGARPNAPAAEPASCNA
jgi:quercetin dioxygenase-like cupin family protein